jgi:hypothetical protein
MSLPHIYNSEFNSYLLGSLYFIFVKVFHFLNCFLLI